MVGSIEMSGEGFINIVGPYKRKMFSKHVGVTSFSEILRENEFARTSETEGNQKFVRWVTMATHNIIIYS